MRLRSRGMVWGDPDRFRPERWATGEPVPYSFVPFGCGYRKCIGSALATLELQVLAVRRAQRVAWQLDRPTARPAGVATFAPKRRCAHHACRARAPRLIRLP